MQAFVYQASGSRVVFGAGSVRRLARELDALHLARALVLCTPQQVDAARLVVDVLGDRAAGIFAGAVM
ncbi:MAG: maleylacetate reductase, partial [Pseudomonadota bacterium]|nr:maleylacetate reductase [Pseudomonadota bacterium]